MTVGAAPDGYISPGTEWDISLLQNNDDQIQFQIANGPVPLDLAGYTLTMYLKATPETPDASGFSNTPQITAALLGQFSVNFPASQLTAPTPVSSPFFYHVDGFQTMAFPNTTTLVFGTVTILPI